MTQGISRRDSEGRLFVAGTAALASIILALFLVASPAHAEPAKITQAKSEAAALRQQVESLGMQVEQAAEDLAYAEWQLGQTKVAIDENQAKLDKAEQDLTVSSERLAKRLDGIYREGEVGFWSALFSAASLTDLLNRVDFLNKIGEEDGNLYEEISSFRKGVSAQRQELAAQKAEHDRLVAAKAQAESSLENKLAQQKSQLKGKEQQVAQLEREEAERQARLAAEARAAAQREAERAAQQRAQAQSSSSASSSSSSSSANRSSGGSSSSSSSSSQPSRSVPRSGSAGSALEAAMSMIGVPYVWGGASPSGFDCSGLMLWAFRQVGVSLPHSSRAQFGYGTAVSRDQLQPGDLVFFGSPIHHVGMYVGGGNYLHAPYSGTTVKISSMSRRDYTGARRIG